MEIAALMARDSSRTHNAGAMADEIVDLKDQLFALRAAVAVSSRIQGLSNQQIDERLRGGLCLRCGSADHYKNDCPNEQR